MGESSWQFSQNTVILCSVLLYVKEQWCNFYSEANNVLAVSAGILDDDVRNQFRVRAGDTKAAATWSRAIY